MSHLLFTCIFSSNSFHCATVCSPLTNQCSIVFWLSVQLIVLQFFPTTKFPSLEMTLLLQSFTCSIAIFLLIHCQPSSIPVTQIKTTPRWNLQQLLVLISVVVLVVDSCFSLKFSPSWMPHQLTPPDCPLP